MLVRVRARVCRFVSMSVTIEINRSIDCKSIRSLFEVFGNYNYTAIGFIFVCIWMEATLANPHRLVITDRMAAHASLLLITPHILILT